MEKILKGMMEKMEETKATGSRRMEIAAGAVALLLGVAGVVLVFSEPAEGPGWGQAFLLTKLAGLACWEIARRICAGK